MMIHLAVAHTHVMIQFLKIQLWKNNIFNTILTLSTLQGGGGGGQELRNDVLTTYKVFCGKRFEQAQCECNGEQ